MSHALMRTAAGGLIAGSHLLSRFGKSATF